MRLQLDTVGCRIDPDRPVLLVTGVKVTQMEQLPEVLPPVDPELGSLVHAELAAHGVEVMTETAVERIHRADGV